MQGYLRTGGVACHSNSKGKVYLRSQDWRRQFFRLDSDTCNLVMSPTPHSSATAVVPLSHGARCADTGLGAHSFQVVTLRGDIVHAACSSSTERHRWQCAIERAAGCWLLAAGLPPSVQNVSAQLLGCAGAELPLQHPAGSELFRRRQRRIVASEAPGMLPWSGSDELVAVGGWLVGEEGRTLVGGQHTGAALAALAALTTVVPDTCDPPAAADEVVSKLASGPAGGVGAPNCSGELWKLSRTTNCGARRWNKRTFRLANGVLSFCAEFGKQSTRRSFFPLSGAVLNCAPVARPRPNRAGLVAPLGGALSARARQPRAQCNALCICLTNGTGSLLLRCSTRNEHALWSATLHVAIQVEQQQSGLQQRGCSCLDGIVQLSASSHASWHEAHTHAPSRPGAPRGGCARGCTDHSSVRV